jgi:hypothetical protein
MAARQTPSSARTRRVTVSHRSAVAGGPAGLALARNEDHSSRPRAADGYIARVIREPVRATPTSPARHCFRTASDCCFARGNQTPGPHPLRPGPWTTAFMFLALDGPLSGCHGLSCLGAAGGRLLQPGDAQAGPLAAGEGAALLLLYGIGRSLGPRSRSSGPGRPRDRNARNAIASCHATAAIASPRFRSRGRSRPDDCFRVRDLDSLGHPIRDNCRGCGHSGAAALVRRGFVSRRARSWRRPTRW